MAQSSLMVCLCKCFEYMLFWLHAIPIGKKLNILVINVRLDF